MRSDSGQARPREPISKHGVDVLHWLRVYHAGRQRLQKQGRGKPSKRVKREKVRAVFDSREYEYSYLPSGEIAKSRGCVFAINKSSLFLWQHSRSCYLRVIVTGWFYLNVFSIIISNVCSSWKRPTSSYERLGSWAPEDSREPLNDESQTQRCLVYHNLLPLVVFSTVLTHLVWSTWPYWVGFKQALPFSVKCPYNWALFMLTTIQWFSRRNTMTVFKV